VRARDESVLAEGNATATVAAEVGHDMANLVVVAGTATLAGRSGRNLVLFARHCDVGYVVVMVGYWLR
jgi:hypothetical protein